MDRLWPEFDSFFDADGFKPRPNDVWWRHIEGGARTWMYHRMLERHSHEAVTRHIRAIAMAMTNRIAMLAERRRREPDPFRVESV
jgi:hypothetical protein